MNMIVSATMATCSPPSFLTPSPKSKPFSGKPSYKVFMEEQKKVLAAKYPFLPAPQIAKRVAGLWAKLSKEQKVKYSVQKPPRKKSITVTSWTKHKVVISKTSDSPFSSQPKISVGISYSPCEEGKVDKKKKSENDSTKAVNQSLGSLQWDPSSLSHDFHPVPPQKTYAEGTYIPPEKLVVPEIVEELPSTQAGILKRDGNEKKRRGERVSFISPLEQEHAPADQRVGEDGDVCCNGETDNITVVPDSQVDNNSQSKSQGKRSRKSSSKKRSVSESCNQEETTVVPDSQPEVIMFNTERGRDGTIKSATINSYGTTSKSTIKTTKLGCDPTSSDATAKQKDTKSSSNKRSVEKGASSHTKRFKSYKNENPLKKVESKHDGFQSHQDMSKKKNEVGEKSVYDLDSDVESNLQQSFAREKETRKSVSKSKIDTKRSRVKSQKEPSVPEKKKQEVRNLKEPDKGNEFEPSQRTIDKYVLKVNDSDGEDFGDFDDGVDDDFEMNGPGNVHNFNYDTPCKQKVEFGKSVGNSNIKSDSSYQVETKKKRRSSSSSSIYKFGFEELDSDEDEDGAETFSGKKQHMKLNNSDLQEKVGSSKLTKNTRKERETSKTKYYGFDDAVDMFGFDELDMDDNKESTSYQHGRKSNSAILAVDDHEDVSDKESNIMFQEYDIDLRKDDKKKSLSDVNKKGSGTKRKVVRGLCKGSHVTSHVTTPVMHGTSALMTGDKSLELVTPMMSHGVLETTMKNASRAPSKKKRYSTPKDHSVDIMKQKLVKVNTRLLKTPQLEFSSPGEAIVRKHGRQDNGFQNFDEELGCTFGFDDDEKENYESITKKEPLTKQYSKVPTESTTKEKKNVPDKEKMVKKHSKGATKFSPRQVKRKSTSSSTPRKGQGHFKGQVNGKAVNYGKSPKTPDMSKRMRRKKQLNVQITPITPTRLRARRKDDFEEENDEITESQKLGLSPAKVITKAARSSTKTKSPFGLSKYVGMETMHYSIQDESNDENPILDEEDADEQVASMGRNGGSVQDKRASKIPVRNHPDVLNYGKMNRNNQIAKDKIDRCAQKYAEISDEEANARKNRGKLTSVSSLASDDEIVEGHKKGKNKIVEDDTLSTFSFSGPNNKIHGRNEWFEKSYSKHKVFKDNIAKSDAEDDDRFMFSFSGPNNRKKRDEQSFEDIEKYGNTTKRYQNTRMKKDGDKCDSADIDNENRHQGTLRDAARRQSQIGKYMKQVSDEDASDADVEADVNVSSEEAESMIHKPKKITTKSSHKNRGLDERHMTEAKMVPSETDGESCQSDSHEFENQMVSPVWSKKEEIVNQLKRKKLSTNESNSERQGKARIKKNEIQQRFSPRIAKKKKLNQSSSSSVLSSIISSMRSVLAQGNPGDETAVRNEQKHSADFNKRSITQPEKYGSNDEDDVSTASSFAESDFKQRLKHKVYSPKFRETGGGDAGCYQATVIVPSNQAKVPRSKTGDHGDKKNNFYPDTCRCKIQPSLFEDVEGSLENTDANEDTDSDLGASSQEGIQQDSSSSSLSKILLRMRCIAAGKSPPSSPPTKKKKSEKMPMRCSPYVEKKKKMQLHGKEKRYKRTVSYDEDDDNHDGSITSPLERPKVKSALLFDNMYRSWSAALNNDSEDEMSEEESPEESTETEQSMDTNYKFDSEATLKNIFLNMRATVMLSRLPSESVALDTPFVSQASRPQSAVKSQSSTRIYQTPGGSIKGSQTSYNILSPALSGVTQLSSNSSSMSAPNKNRKEDPQGYIADNDTCTTSPCGSMITQATTDIFNDVEKRPGRAETGSQFRKDKTQNREDQFEFQSCSEESFQSWGQRYNKQQKKAVEAIKQVYMGRKGHKPKSTASSRKQPAKPMASRNSAGDTHEIKKGKKTNKPLQKEVDLCRPTKQLSSLIYPSEEPVVSSKQDCSPNDLLMEPACQSRKLLSPFAPSEERWSDIDKMSLVIETPNHQEGNYKEISPSISASNDSLAPEDKAIFEKDRKISKSQGTPSVNREKNKCEPGPGATSSRGQKATAAKRATSATAGQKVMTGQNLASTQMATSQKETSPRQKTTKSTMDKAASAIDQKTAKWQKSTILTGKKATAPKSQKAATAPKSQKAAIAPHKNPTPAKLDDRYGSFQDELEDIQQIASNGGNVLIGDEHTEADEIENTPQLNIKKSHCTISGKEPALTSSGKKREACGKRNKDGYTETLSKSKAATANKTQQRRSLRNRKKNSMLNEQVAGQNGEKGENSEGGKFGRQSESCMELGDNDKGTDPGQGEGYIQSQRQGEGQFLSQDRGQGEGQTESQHPGQGESQSITQDSDTTPADSLVKNQDQNKIEKWSVSEINTNKIPSIRSQESDHTTYMNQLVPPDCGNKNTGKIANKKPNQSKASFVSNKVRKPRTRSQNSKKNGTKMERSTKMKENTCGRKTTKEYDTATEISDSLEDMDDFAINTKPRGLKRQVTKPRLKKYNLKKKAKGSLGEKATNKLTNTIPKSDHIDLNPSQNQSHQNSHGEKQYGPIQSQKQVKQSKKPINSSQETTPNSQESVQNSQVVTKGPKQVPTWQGLIVNSQEPVLNSQEKVPSSQERFHSCQGVNSQDPVPNSQNLVPNSQDPVPNSQNLVPNSQDPVPNSQNLVVNSQDPVANSQEQVPNSQDPESHSLISSSPSISNLDRKRKPRKASVPVHVLRVRAAAHYPKYSDMERLASAFDGQDGQETRISTDAYEQSYKKPMKASRSNHDIRLTTQSLAEELVGHTTRESPIQSSDHINTMGSPQYVPETQDQFTRCTEETRSVATDTTGQSHLFRETESIVTDTTCSTDQTYPRLPKKVSEPQEGCVKKFQSHQDLGLLCNMFGQVPSTPDSSTTCSVAPSSRPSSRRLTSGRGDGQHNFLKMFREDQIFMDPAK